jgi:molecular chaperone DnaK (HSP70)
MWIPAGIDFGNDNTVICLPTATGIEIIANPEAGRISPTAVTYGDDRRYWGGSGEREQIRYTAGGVSQLKKLIGLPFSSPSREALASVIGANLVPLDDGLTGVEVTFRGQTYVLRPEQVLAYLVKGAEALVTARDPRVGRFVLTTSPSWNDKQRRIVTAACRLAGKPCLALVNAPTSVAAAYTMLHNEKLPLDNPVPALFLDFGSSEMTAAVAQLKFGSVEMLSVTNAPQLGGSEFTSLLVQYLISKVQSNFKTDPTTNPRAIIRFRRATERLKRTLSINPMVTFEVQSLPGDVDVSFVVKREEFVAQIQDLIDEISSPIEEALSLANVKMEDLQIIEILGGGSRIPAIREKVAAIVGREPTQSLNLDECCAAGTGYLAALMSPGSFRVPLVLRDILTIPVIAKWAENEQTVFERFASLPSSSDLTVKTVQTAEVSLYSGNEEIGRLRVETASEEEIEITIKLRLTVSSIVEVEGVFAGEDKHPVDYTVEWLGQVPEEKFQEMIAIEEGMDNADREEQLIDETKNSLEAALFALDGALRDIPQYFTACEKENAEKIAADIRLWHDENEFDRLPIGEYQTRLNQLRATVDPITARRRTRDALLDKGSALKQRLAVVEKNLKDDTQHSNDPEHEAIRNELSRISGLIDSFASQQPWDESPFDIAELSKAVDDVAKRQTALKGKPIQIQEDLNSKRRPDTIRNKLFGCGADDDWEPDARDPRRSTENDDNELRRRLSMEDLNEGDYDPWSQFLGVPRRWPRYPQRGHAEPGASARRAAEAEAVRRAEIERQNELRRLENERRERELAERQRRSSVWGQPWGANGWVDEQAEAQRRAEAAAQRKRLEDEQRRKAEEEQQRRRAATEAQRARKGQNDSWDRGLGGQWGGSPWGSSWNDAFF